jgi:hypothetical protein
VERPFKQRDISIRNEITEFSSEGESLSFASSRECVDPEIGVRHVRRVEWSGRPFKRRNISIRNEITKFSSKCESLRFAICRDCFDTEIGVRYVRRVEWSGKTV